MWAYADPSGVPLSITNPLPGTIRIATALVFGALAGVLCERAGVINIAIEGQFIAGAFFGSLFSSFAVASLAFIPIFWCPVFGLLGGILAGMGVAAMLAVFALRYHVDQVIVGVVLVAFGYGITSFLLGQIPGDKKADLNNPELLQPVEIPGLSRHPVHRGTAVRAEPPRLRDVPVGAAGLVPALRDPLGAAGAVRRRAPPGRGHGRHQRQPQPVAGRAPRWRLRRSGRGVVHADDGGLRQGDDGRSTASSPSQP